MRTVFGLDNRVIEDPVSRTPLVVPVGRHRRDAQHLHPCQTRHQENR